MRRWITVLGCGVLLSVSTVAQGSTPLARRPPTTTTTTAPPQTTPTQYLQGAVRAVGLAGSVHEVWSASFGNHSVVVTADLSTASSSASVVDAVGSKRGAVQLTTIGSIAYLNADAFSLRNLFGVSQASAAKLAGRWISFTPRDDLYEAVSSTASYRAILSGLSLRGGLSATKVVGTDASAQVRLVGIEAGPSDGAVPSGQQVAITISASTSLPVSELPAKAQASPPWSVQFSSWGETVSVTAPAGATPASTLKFAGHLELGR